MWLPTFLQRGIHFFGERTEVLAFNNLILFDRIHLPIIGKRAAVVEEKAALLSQSAVTLRRVATSIQFTPCSTAMNRGDGLIGPASHQSIELFH